MKLLSLFFLRLQRNHIIIAVLSILILSMTALSYRNILETEQIRIEERNRIVAVKKEAKMLLYSSNKGTSYLTAEEISHYRRILDLTASYLEKEHIEGKSQQVLTVELAFFQEQYDWLEQGNRISQYSENEVAEKLTLLPHIINNSLSYQYLTAPKDFYLIAVQIIPATSFLLPLVITASCLWILISDLNKHRGILFINGITPKYYAQNLTLLSFLSYLFLYLTLFVALISLSQAFSFTFQEQYPLLNHGLTLAVVSVTEEMRFQLLKIGSIILLHLLSIRFIVEMMVNKYKSD